MILNEQTVDCIWSDFGPWSKCSKTCGFGTQKRKRFFAIAAKGPDGKPCLGAPNEERSCNQKACITTTTRRPTTSTSLKTTDIVTSGTTTFHPPQKTFSSTENDSNPENDISFPITTISTPDSSPLAPQAIENAPISETTSTETTTQISNIIRDSSLEGIDSNSALKTTSTDSTNTNQLDNSTSIPFTDTPSPLQKSIISKPLLTQNVSDVVISFHKKKILSDLAMPLDIKEIRNMTIIDKIETKNETENEIEDVEMGSQAKALNNAIAFDDSNAKKSTIENDVTSSITLSSFQENNVSPSKDLSKVDDISDSSLEISTVVSATNDLQRNLKLPTNPQKPNSNELSEDKLEDDTASFDEPKAEDFPISPVEADSSPFVSLNGVGDIESE